MWETSQLHKATAGWYANIVNLSSCVASVHRMLKSVGDSVLHSNLLCDPGM